MKIRSPIARYYKIKYTVKKPNKRKPSALKKAEGTKAFLNIGHAITPLNAIY